MLGRVADGLYHKKATLAAGAVSLLCALTWSLPSGFYTLDRRAALGWLGDPVGYLLGGAMAASVVMPLLTFWLLRQRIEADPCKAKFKTLAPSLMFGGLVLTVGLLPQGLWIGPMVLAAGYALLRWKEPEEERGRLADARTQHSHEIADAGHFEGEILLGWEPYSTRNIWEKGDGHLITVARTGSGKGVSAVLPNLLQYPGSVVCVDPKGENAAVTIHARRELGSPPLVLNPFGLHTQKPWELPEDCFNPLDIPDPDSRYYVSDIRLIANSIVTRGYAKDPYWDNEAENLIATLLLYVREACPPGERTLTTLRDLLSLGEADWAALLDKMGRMPQQGGLIAKGANRFATKEPRTASNIKSTAETHTQWLDDPNMQAVVQSNPDWDMSRIMRESRTVFLCIPPDQLRPNSGWLRMMLNLIMARIIRTRGSQRVLFVIDEFPELGRLQMAETAIGVLRGYGVKLWPIIQDLDQLKTIYEDRWQSFMSNSNVWQLFGTNDVFTAEFISKALGEEMTVSHNTNAEGEITMADAKRELLTIEEVMRHPGQIIRFAGERPIYANSVKYYEEPSLNKWALPNPFRVPYEEDEDVPPGGFDD